MAIFRWLQEYAADENGFKWASPDGWDADLDKSNKGVLAVIGGAWHYNTAKAALGETNLGIALIPTFTLTEKSVEGLSGVKAGDVYRGGTFADCKCFMINANSSKDKYAAEQELIKFMSSKEIQNRSYLACLNVPVFRAIVDKTAYPTTGDTILSETESLAGIRKALYLAEYLWMHGTTPKEFPATLPDPA